MQPASCAVAATAAVQPAGYATLVVNVPSNATVYLAGQRMNVTGESRHFRIPVTTGGKAYPYPVRVEVVQNGNVVVNSQTSTVMAGMITTVNVPRSVATASQTVAAR